MRFRTVLTKFRKGVYVFFEWFSQSVFLKEFFFVTSVFFFFLKVFFSDFFQSFFRSFFLKKILLSNMQMFLRFSIYDVSSKRFFSHKGCFFILNF